MAGHIRHAGPSLSWKRIASNNENFDISMLITSHSNLIGPMGSSVALLRRNLIEA